jgi:hypothetical protein
LITGSRCYLTKGEWVKRSKEGMHPEAHDLTGRVDILLTDSNGRLLEHRSISNAIVNSGRTMVARLFAGMAAIKTIKAGVGTQSGDVLPTHNIDHRNFLAFTDIDEATVTMDELNNRANLSFSSTFAAHQANASLMEAGIVFVDAAEDKILYNGVTFSKIDKKEGDVLTLNWEIVF